jgi:protease-4
MFSTQRPFSDDEWARLEGWLDRVYADFTEKAAADRGLPLERVQELAKGRVWTGADAVSNGLVDRLGGLEDALELACRRAGLRREDTDVKALPHLSLRQRLQKPESSEHPGAGRAALDHPLLATALEALGLPPFTGVLSLPVGWQLA